MVGQPELKRFTNQPHREFVYRMAYQMGRHVIGYEVQKVLAAVDWFAQDEDHPPIGVSATAKAACWPSTAPPSTRASHQPCVSGYFGPRENLHDEPIYRNVWGLLKEFGDAELARLIVPRSLIIEHAAFSTGEPPPARAGPRRAPPRAGSARAARRRRCWSSSACCKRCRRSRTIPAQAGATHRVARIPTARDGAQRCADYLKGLTDIATPDDRLAPPKELRLCTIPKPARNASSTSSSTTRRSCCPTPSHAARSSSGPSSTPRRSTSSRNRRSRCATTSTNDIIGKLPEPTMPLNPRTRLHLRRRRKWKGYEVVLDVYDDVICYGILLVPNDSSRARSGRCVVCQHGLEGRPTDVVDPKKKTQYYNSFGAQLADRGFIVFAPQNPYIFKNEFRQVVAQGQPARAVALLVHRPPARAHPRLARHAAVRRSGAHRVLRPVLRRQGGDAHPGDPGAVLPVDLLGRLQRVDLEEHHARLAAAATCSPASTRCTSSTWATPSTTRRWPP